jgi:hypothetical protein
MSLFNIRHVETRNDPELGFFIFHSSENPPQHAYGKCYTKWQLCVLNTCVLNVTPIQTHTTLSQCSLFKPKITETIQAMYVLHRCKMTNKCIKELVDFINVLQILPRHVSASGYHFQGAVGA